MTMPLRFWVPVLIVSLFASRPAGDAIAATEGKTAQGEAYVSGGVSLGEREALDARRANFSLWVATAAKASGSYLADVSVTITDDAGNPVLETQLDGPWLLVNLKHGRYTVEARFDSKIQRKTTTVHKNDHHEMLFYFDAQVETLPRGARE